MDNKQCFFPGGPGVTGVVAPNKRKPRLQPAQCFEQLYTTGRKGAFTLIISRSPRDVFTRGVNLEAKSCSVVRAGIYSPLGRFTPGEIFPEGALEHTDPRYFVTAKKGAPPLGIFPPQLGTQLKAVFWHAPTFFGNVLRLLTSS